MSALPAVGLPVSIAGVDQMGPAWLLQNPEDLLSDAPDVGENVPMPGVDGQIGQNFELDQNTIDLRYIFVGDVAPNGTPHSDPEVGLELNRRAFKASVMRATRDAFGCVECVVYAADGTPFSAGIQMRTMRWQMQGRDVATAVVTVVIPDGELTEGGS